MEESKVMFRNYESAQLARSVRAKGVHSDVDVSKWQ